MVSYSNQNYSSLKKSTWTHILIVGQTWSNVLKTCIIWYELLHGRLLKWAIKLNEFNIMYRQRSTIKGQVLIDFIAKLLDISGDSLSDRLWILNTDETSKRVGD